MTRIVGLMIAGILVWCLTLTIMAQPPGKGPPGKGGPGKGPPGKGGGMNQQPAHPEDKANFGDGKENPAPATPAGLTHLGGRWYLKQGTPKTYIYRDADRFIEPFGNIGDSNKDGIADLIVSHDEKYIILDSQNLPNHPHAPFPNSGNPNSVIAQKMRFKLPIVPKIADSITRVPMGPIGVAVNGVVFFNPFEAGGMNAVQGYRSEWLDSCCGHPQQSGVYHYHKYPSCVKSPFPDDGHQHSPPIGFAWDGYPVYGPYESDGVEAKLLTGDNKLDVCNGHFDAERGYHYHVTPEKFPYVIGGYAGVAEQSNGRGIGRDPVGAIRDNATGVSRFDQSLKVTPGTIGRGKTFTLKVELLQSSGRTQELPSRVVLGPYVATSVKKQGNDLMVDVKIPSDAACCQYDMHLEYRSGGSRGPTVVKQNEAVRVKE
ncbi:MAG: YHYH protein [Gemmatales bacterium]